MSGFKQEDYGLVPLLEPLIMKVFGCNSLKIKYLTSVRDGLCKLYIRIYDKNASYLDLEFLRNRILEKNTMYGIECEIKNAIDSRMNVRIKRIQFPELCNLSDLFFFACIDYIILISSISEYLSESLKSESIIFSLKFESIIFQK